MSAQTAGNAATVPPLQLPPGDAWSLGAVGLQRLLKRFTAASLVAAGVGGALTALMVVPYLARAETQTSTAADPVMLGVPIAVVAITVGRFLVSHGRGRPAPGDRWIAAVATGGIAATVALAWPKVDGNALPVHPVLESMVGMAMPGAILGLVTGVLNLAVMLPVLLALRGTRARTSLGTVQTVLSVGAMIVTAAWGLYITSWFGIPLLTGMATALAGACALVASRQVLSPTDR